MRDNAPPPQSAGGGPCAAWWRGLVRALAKTFAHARHLRRIMTVPEVRRWSVLRRSELEGLRFRRQHPIGPYILDFYCPSARLAIEIDGFAHDTVAEANRDARRQEWLAQRDVRVLRLRASDVLKDQNLEGALLGIKEMASIAPSGSLRSPPPPPRGGGA